MSTLKLANNGTNFGFFDRVISNNGTSEASKYLSEILNSSYSDLKQNAYTWARYNEAVEDLREIYCETRETGWDGYDALTIPDSAFENANLFINNLPSWVIFPEIIPDTDGSIGFQWSSEDKQKALIISIYSDGVIHYAVIMAPFDKEHGKKLFDGAIPGEIIKKIKAVTMA